MGAEKKAKKKKKSKEELERDAERDARLKKRDIRDYSDDDIHRLLEQWEEDDEPIPPDELPDGHPDKPPPAMDFSKVDMTNPENVMAASKKGQSVMLFVDIQGISDPEMAEEMSSLWQTGLANNHVPCERMMVEDFQAMFFFRDGSHAWEAKNFFLEQEEVLKVRLDEKDYNGKHSPQGRLEEKERRKKEKQDRQKAKDKKKKVEL